MNSYRRNSPRTGLLSGQSGRLFAITLIVILVFVADLASDGTIRNFSQGAAGNISGTTAAAFNAVKHSGIFSTRARLAGLNQELQAEVERYREQDAAYQALKAENDQLALLAHLAQDNTGTTTAIVSSFRSSPYGTFLIGAGAQEGINHDSIVLDDLGFVVGRVTDVSTHTSLVTQLLSPGKSVDALINEHPATFTGAGGGNARAQVPRDIAVEVGNIVTSGDVGGRRIGIVGKVESESADAYSTVYMRLPQNVSSMRFVFVLSGAQ